MDKGRIPRNYVLVAVPQEKHDSFKTKSGVELYVDSTFEPEKHSISYGEVRMVPDKMVYTGVKGDENSLEFDVEMELKVGDKVHFHYLQSVVAVKKGMVIDYNGERCIFIRYDRIFFAKRKDGIVPVNGWIVVEPIFDDKIKSDIIYIPESMKSQPKPQEGIVRHIGACVRNYIFHSGEGGDTDELKVGDKIAFGVYASVPIEYKLHETLGKMYYRMQRRDVIGVYAGV